MKMEKYSAKVNADKESIETIANIAKDLMLGKLFRDGVITEDMYNHYSREYMFVMQKPSIVSNLLRRIFDKPDDYHLFLTKIMHPHPNEQCNIVNVSKAFKEQK